MITLKYVLNNPVADGIKAQIAEATKAKILGFLSGLCSVISDLSYSIALIGGGICIVLYVAGWEKGGKWAGILTAAYALIKYLLG